MPFSELLFAFFMVYTPIYSGSISVKVETLVLIPYLIKLLKIKSVWEIGMRI